MAPDMFQPNDEFPAPPACLPSDRKRRYCAPVRWPQTLVCMASTGRVELNPRRCDNKDWNERHAPVRPSCAARPATGADCTTISRQITEWSYVRALCDADVN